MNQTNSAKQAYVCPTVEVINTALESQLMHTSFPNNGGHNDAGDDGQDLNAKQNFFDEEDEGTISEHQFGSI